MYNELSGQNGWSCMDDVDHTNWLYGLDMDGWMDPTSRLWINHTSLFWMDHTAAGYGWSCTLVGLGWTTHRLVGWIYTPVCYGWTTPVRCGWILHIHNQPVWLVMVNRIIKLK